MPDGCAHRIRANSKNSRPPDFLRCFRKRQLDVRRRFAAANDYDDSTIPGDGGGLRVFARLQQVSPNQRRQQCRHKRSQRDDCTRSWRRNDHNRERPEILGVETRHRHGFAQGHRQGEGAL